MAIDRDFIVDKARRSGETAAYSFVPPGVANYPRAARFRWDVAAAAMAEVFAEALR